MPHHDTRSPVGPPAQTGPIRDRSQDRFLGTLLGDRYRLVKRIGRGGMGVVYRAQDLKLGGRPCAVKLLRQDTDHGFDGARFEKEIELMSRLSSPHIVNVTDTGCLFDGSPFVVMELLRGRNLAQILKIHGAIAPRRAVKMILDVLSGLDVAHRQGIVHRDIKPGNVFLCRNRYGEVMTKILDFGVATDINAKSDTEQASAHAYGTAVYMAPEQFKRRPCDGMADLYGAGVLLYRMIAGKNPFSARDPVPEAIANRGTIRRLSWLHENAVPPTLGVDIALRTIIARLMAPDPADRFATAEEAIGALEDWLDAEQEEVSAVDDIADAPSELAVFAGEGSSAVAEAPFQIKRLLGPMILAASILVLSLAFPESRAPKETHHGLQTLCTHRIASAPSGATIYHGESRLGVTPMVISRPCQEVWLISLRHPSMKEYPMKLRGHVHNEFGEVTMEAAGGMAPELKTGSPNHDKAADRDVRRSNGPPTQDDFERPADWVMPTGHGGMFQGI